MTDMFDFGVTERPYWDRKNWPSLDAYKEALKVSTTLYVGNLSFYTQESQIYALFDQVRFQTRHRQLMLVKEYLKQVYWSSLSTTLFTTPQNNLWWGLQAR